jgi:hypothetical protein
VAALAERPLPGVLVAAEPPSDPVVLPRMDVAALIGFAAAGPLGVPVPIDDPGRFAAVFGADLPLARDERGETGYAYLGPAVRAFFANGGRRCWVIRVGDPATAETSRFEIPGVARLDGGGLVPATLGARSPGTWADGLRAGAALRSRPLRLHGVDVRRLVVRVGAYEAAAVRLGDLLRLRGDRETLLLPVAGVDGEEVTGDPSGAVWLSDDRPSGAGSARFAGADGVVRTVAAHVDADGVVVAVAASQAPPLGTLVAVDGLGQGTLWLRVERVRGVRAGSPPGGAQRLGGASVVARAAERGPDGATAPSLDRAELLTLVLRAGGNGLTWLLDDLAFSERHPRYLGALPTDDRRFAPPDPAIDDERHRALREEATERSFPLAAGGADPFVPLLVPPTPELLAARRPSGRPPLARNGLAAFDESLFLDPRLAGHSLYALAGELDAVLADPEGVLRGVHAAYALDEATLVAAPDALQRPWRIEAALPPVRPAPPAEPLPLREGFAECAPPGMPAPVLELAGPDAEGAIRLRWTASDAEGPTYLVEESDDPAGFGDPAVVHRGGETSVALLGRADGARAFRVRAEAAGRRSDWSNVVSIAPAADAVAHFTPGGDDVGVAVARALARLAAARGDMVALLALPRAESTADALARLGAIRSRSAAGSVPPIDASEARAWTHAAAYLPWLLAEDTLRAEPPVGAVLGVIARRSAERGAWVAPANEPLLATLGLEGTAGVHDPRPLQAAQLNLLARGPAGVLVMSQDTLADAGDPDLRPLNVRRLLALIRRVAWLHGRRWVFEPNDHVLERSARRGFEALMARLHGLGAFAGATPAEAYRVEVGDPPNSSAGVDAGRFIVELKVAPSRPLAFLTVRLLAWRDGGAAIEAP